MLVSPCTFALPSAIWASSVFAPIIVSSRSERLTREDQVGLVGDESLDAVRPILIIVYAVASLTQHPGLSENQRWDGRRQSVD